MSKNGYEPIPDVELGLESSEDAKRSAKERYPDANDEEVELLGMLDNCIEGANVTVDLPDVSSDVFGKSTTNCCCAAIFPTIVFLTLLGGALWQSKVGQPLPYVSMYATYLPYMVAMILFLASIEPISTRLMSQASKVLALSKDAQGEIESNIDDVGTLVKSNVVSVENKLKPVVETYRPKLARSTKDISVLKKVDSSVEVPNIDGLEKELEGATDELGNNIEEVKASISIDQFIPPLLQSRGAYRCRVIFPTLLCCLAFQMTGAFVITYFFPLVGMLTSSDTPSSTNEMSSTGMHRSLDVHMPDVHMPDIHMPDVHMPDDMHVKEYVDEAEVFSEELYKEVMELAFPIWPCVLLICEAYVMAILQITLIYIVSRPGAWLHTIRHVRSQVKEFANQKLLDKGTNFICKDVLLTRMQRVKDRVLFAITAIGKLDKAMDKVGDLLDFDDGSQDNGNGNEPLRINVAQDANPLKNLGASFSKFFSPR